MERKALNVLFLGGAKRVSIGRMFKEAAARLGYELNIFSSELRLDVPISSIGEVLIAPRWADPDMDSWLEHTVAEHEIGLLIPFVDPAIELVARFRDAHPGVFVPTGDTALAVAMFDKVDAAQMFERVGVSVPPTLSIGDAHYPKIAKPRRGSASQGIVVINTPDDISRLAGDVDDYLIQEYIPRREEYTVDCYVKLSGEVVCAVPRLRVETAGGEVVRSVTVDIPELNEAVAHVLRATDLRGAVTLQFIHDLDNGRWLLMEINPRLGGGAVTAVHAGADIPEYILREALGLPVEAASWEAGVEIARYMQEVVFRGILP